MMAPTEHNTRDTFTGLTPCEEIEVVGPAGNTKPAEFIRVEKGGQYGTVVERDENGDVERRYTVSPQDIVE